MRISDHRRVAEQHPWIRYALEHRDGVAEKRHAPQTRDLEVVDVPPDQKRDQQVERAQARDGPRQPSPPRAEVKRHEPRGRDQHTQQRNMCPPHRREEFFGRPDLHLPQFTKREGRCGGCGHGKEQIGPGGAVAPPHQKVDHRQREARRRDHGPDDGDPTHELSFPDSMRAQAWRGSVETRPAPAVRTAMRCRETRTRARCIVNCPRDVVGALAWA